MRCTLAAFCDLAIFGFVMPCPWTKFLEKNIDGGLAWTNAIEFNQTELCCKGQRMLWGSGRVRSPLKIAGALLLHNFLCLLKSIPYDTKLKMLGREFFIPTPYSPSHDPPGRQYLPDVPPWWATPVPPVTRKPPSMENWQDTRSHRGRRGSYLNSQVNIRPTTCPILARTFLSAHIVTRPSIGLPWGDTSVY
jgi:hypothetical protein